MSESELIAHLIEAQRAGARSIDQGEMVEIDRAAAYRIQAGVMHGLGERPGVIKTAVQSDGMGVAAPIYASHVGHAPRFSLSAPWLRAPSRPSCPASVGAPTPCRR